MIDQSYITLALIMLVNLLIGFTLGFKLKQNGASVKKDKKGGDDDE
jgi:hypothetical protein